MALNRDRYSSGAEGPQPGRAVIRAGNYLAIVCLFFGAAFAAFVPGSFGHCHKNASSKSTTEHAIGSPSMIFEEAHRCIKRGDTLSLVEAFDAGLNPNLANQFSWTLLMLSAIEGNTTIGQLLISRGSDVNATNNFGETPLALAAQAGHAPFVQLLLSNGASTNCFPHGCPLGEWISQASGLTPKKMATMLALLGSKQ